MQQKKMSSLGSCTSGNSFNISCMLLKNLIYGNLTLIFSYLCSLLFMIWNFHGDCVMMPFQVISREGGVSIHFRDCLSQSSGVQMMCDASAHLYCWMAVLAHTTEGMVCGVRCLVMSVPSMDHWEKPGGQSSSSVVLILDTPVCLHCGSFISIWGGGTFHISEVARLYQVSVALLSSAHVLSFYPLS